LRKELEVVKSKAEKFDQYDKAKRIKLKEELGDNWVTSFDVIPLEELETLSSKINKSEKVGHVDNGTGKKGQPGKLELLQKDLEMAKQRNDLVAQMNILDLIEKEKK
jgi:hypothetical protein